MIALSVAVIAILTALFLQQFENALNERVLLQLSSVKQLKILKIKAELNDRMEAFSRLIETQNATGYSASFDQFDILDSLPDSIPSVALDDRAESIKMIDCSDLRKNDYGLFSGFSR